MYESIFVRQLSNEIIEIISTENKLYVNTAAA